MKWLSAIGLILVVALLSLPRTCAGDIPPDSPTSPPTPLASQPAPGRAVQDARDDGGQPRDPLLARSSAQPTLSLEGHLRDRLARMGWGDGNDYARQSSPGKDYASATRSPILNPRQKTPSPAQLEELKALVARHEQLVAEATHHEGQLRTGAYLRAMDQGGLRTIEAPRAENPLDPAQSAAAQKAGQALHQRVMEDAARTMGKAGSDFVYTILTSSQPDGVSRSNYVFVQRVREPDYFRALDAMKTRIDERDRDLAAFFGRL